MLYVFQLNPTQKLRIKFYEMFLEQEGLGQKNQLEKEKHQITCIATLKVTSYHHFSRCYALDVYRVAEIHSSCKPISTEISVLLRSSRFVENANAKCPTTDKLCISVSFIKSSLIKFIWMANLL